MSARMMSIDAALQKAVAHHQAGELRDAERIYRLILQAQPGHPDANHNLGVLAVQVEQPAGGIPHLKAALQADPAREQYWVSYIQALARSGQVEAAREALAQGRQGGLNGAAVEVLAGALEGPTTGEVNQVLGLFSQGRYPEGEALARELTQRYPRHGFGWKALGALLKQQGKLEEALLPMQTAAALLPGDAEVHNNLATTYRALDRLAEAEAGFRKAIELKPGFAEAHNNLGGLLKELGCLTEAETSCRRALELSPDYAKAHNNLGAVLNAQSRFAEAEASYCRALVLKPDYAEAHNNLGVTLNALDRWTEAETCHRRAIALRPDYAEAHDNLGITLDTQDRLAEAEASYRRALALKPDYAEAHNNLGATLMVVGRPAEAEASFRRALELKPDYVEAHNNLGEFLRTQGRLPEAESSQRRALELNPDDARAHRNFSVALAYLSDYRQVVAESDAALRLKADDERIWEGRLYTFSYHPDLSAEEIYGEFVRWGDRFPDPVVDFASHDRSPGRRLRVGYVSPDFRNHTSRFYFWPLFANHDHAAVELYAYSNVKIEDGFTGKFKLLFDHWRNIRGVADDEVARRVREDGIDILVDCCNHMQDDRLGVFTLKPAPVQVTWLGAAWTTGLKMVDYVLFDPYLAPEGTLARETIVRLPHFFVAYLPPETTAEVVSPPCLKNGHVTFGYSGRTERLNHRTFRVWGEILRRIPNARLILDFRPFADPPTQAHYRRFMAEHGVEVGRVVMRKSANIFEGLNDIDILLDCFPHSGGTMLFDALWMGVPVLTLAGRPPVGRIGTSLMMNLGLPEWVAHGEEEYIGKACGFAGDRGKLAELRAGMRERMRASPVMDGQGFASGVEAAYREMFAKWATQ